MKKNPTLKRATAAALALASATTILTGCAGKAASSTEVTSTAASSVNEAPASEAATSDEPVTLRFMWWGGDERHAATLEVIKNFMELHPNITIEAEYSGSDGYLEKLSTQLYSGTAAELLQVGPGWVPDLLNKGDFFVDFSQYTDKIDMSGFDAEYVKNSSVFNGIQVGLPTGIAAPALIVNTTLVDAAGISLDELTWESLIQAGKDLQAYDSEAYLMNIDSPLIYTTILRPYIMQLTGSPMLDNTTNEMSFTKEQLVEVLSYIQQLYDDKVVQPAGESAAFKNNTPTNPKWIEGKFGMSVGVSSTINTFTTANPNAEYNVVRVPLMADRKNDGFYVNTPQIMCIPKTVEQDEAKLNACFLFYDYFFNDPSAAEILKDLRSVPPTEQARQICVDKGLLAPIVSKSIDLSLNLNGKNEMGLTTAAEVETICIDAIEKVAYGKASVDQIADETIVLLSDYLANQ